VSIYNPKHKPKLQYDDALEHLKLLQPNRAVTELFDKSPSVSSSHTWAETAAAAAAASQKPQAPGLNAEAIPEMLYWLRRAGYTRKDLARLRHIHVAGTKGKGSVCAYTTSMLRKYGRVGTFTSPHLVSPRERIALDGEPVTQGQFTRTFFRMWRHFTNAAVAEGMPREEAQGPKTKPFFFRYLTIMAWDIFLRQGVDAVVMECGIGGEYDSTNVLPPLAVSACVITQLGIDHVSMLGDTVDKIAWHKAGILKLGTRGFTRDLAGQQEVMDVLKTRATEKGAGLVAVPDDAVEQWGGVAGGLGGDFQKYNQALAVLAVMHHMGMDSNPETALRNIPEEMVDGLREAKLRGRCETVQDGDLTWLLDGAHTKDSLEQVAIWLSQVLLNDHGQGDNNTNKPSVVLVFNQQERDIAPLLSDFIRAVQRHIPGAADGIFSHALFTRNEQDQPGSLDAPRDLSVQRTAENTMRELLPGCETQVLDNITQTVDEARRLAELQGPGSKVLVTGSLHLVGGVLLALDPEPESLK
jgi:folylpolyglutamate synthase